MRKSHFDWIAIIAVVSLLTVSAAVAADKAEQEKADAFKAAKREVQLLLRSRRPSDRADAFRRLEEYPIVDSARMIMSLAFKGQPDEVRKAGFETLLTYKDNPEICGFLLETLKREATSKASRETIFPLVSVLLASDLPESESGLFAALERFTTVSKTGMLMVLSLADDLGRQGDEASLAALAKLAKSDLMEREFPFRRSIVHAMTRIEENQAVDVLIKLLGELDGEVRGDIIRHLRDISGKDFDIKHEAWAKWWAENRETFRYPSDAQVVVQRVSTEPSSLSSYYGMPLYAKRIVFVLDTSGSMSGGPLAAAKQELVYAIGKLPSETEFGVVVFNTRVGAWDTKLTPATSEAKKAATSFVMSQRADGRTASYDALQAAFGFDAEAIYFLTDGKPTNGKIVVPGQIVAAISDANRTQWKSVYTIGVGAAQEGFDTFLKALAEKNFGVYREVER